MMAQRWRDSLLDQNQQKDGPDLSQVSSPGVQDLQVSSPRVQDLQVSSPRVQDLQVSSPGVQDLQVSSPGVQDLQDQIFSWPGPKTLHLRRTSQGFGFTLRHFIVYPPESAVHNCLKNQEKGGRGRPRLEPMDTIFVKQVKEGGSAHRAGLCTGDRMLKVNGESIVGKTYSQVIALIQNSDSSLELSVMPKDEDILQLFSRDISALAYSRDAYLRGNKAFSGRARNIPEPPPICYPRVAVKSTGTAQSTDPGTGTHSPPGPPQGPQRPGARTGTTEKNCPVPIQQKVVCSEPVRTEATPPVPVRTETTPPAHVRTEATPPAHVRTEATPPAHVRTEATPPVHVRTEATPPVHVRTEATPPKPVDRGPRVARAGPSHRTEEDREPGSARPVILKVPGRAQVQVSSLPVEPPSGSRPTTVQPEHLFQPTRVPIPACSPAQHQNIDWRTYTTYKDYIDAKGLHTYGCRTIQERLDTLRASSGSAYTQQPSSPRALPSSQVRHRSISIDRAAPAGGPGSSGTSLFHFFSQERHGVSIDQTNTSRNLPRSVSQDALPSSTPTGSTKPRTRSCDHLGRSPVESCGRDRTGFEPGSRRVLNQRLCGLEDPAQGSGFSKTDGIIMRPSRLPVRTSDPALVVPTNKTTDQDQRLAVLDNPLQVQLRTRTDSLKLVNRVELGLGARSSSCSGPSSKPAPHGSNNGVLTHRPKVSSADPLLQNYGGLPDGVEGPDATVVVLRRDRTSERPPIRPSSYVQAVNDGQGGLHRSQPLLKAGSVDGTTFCRNFHSKKHKSGTKHLHESLESIPFIDDASSPSLDLDLELPTITTIPPSPTSPCPLLRRQLSHDQDSFHLTIVDAERSKSCDEGLDDYRDQRRSLIPGVKGLRKVDGWSEDPGSMRGCSSDVIKEGFLHFKQLKGSSGVRPWKQVYAVLKGNYLNLYRDQKQGLSPEEPSPIDIKGCLTDISYSDTKRKNVLRLTTAQHHFLFQAPDRDHMLSWIRVIRETSQLDQEDFSSHDLISRKIKEYHTCLSPTGGGKPEPPRPARQNLSIRQTLLGGKDTRTTGPNPKNLNTEESPPRGSWRKGIPGLMRKPFEKRPSAGATFGVRLEDCPPGLINKGVPLIVELCCHLVEDRGLEYTGIYRVPGNNAAISNLQEELNLKGLSDINVQSDKWRDLNVISSLLKSFFRKLPEPLFTNDRYSDFIDANRVEDPVQRLRVLKTLLHELPDHHYQTLKFLSAHLKTVAENSEKNKMEPRNLAIVFGPTLVRTTEDNMTHMVTHMPDHYRIVETLIQNYDWFFGDDETGDPGVSPDLVEGGAAVESQPVPNIDHLLPNIGRTPASQGEVSDSPNSDSAKSKGSWGSGTDPSSRDLWVSSIFAVAGRKRKKSKDKAAVSSSDEDLVHLNHLRHLRHQAPETHPSPNAMVEDRKEIGRRVEVPPKAKRSSSVLKEKTPSRHSSARPGRWSLSDPPSAPPGRWSLSDPPSAPPGRWSLSDPPSENTSDLGTMSSGTSVPRSRPKTCSVGATLDLPAASAGAEVSSITSDYSTTSSFLTAAESSVLSPEPHGGEEADDERSELISEGRPTETDSESDFPVFPGGVSQSTPCSKTQGKAATKLESRRLFPPREAISRRWSLRQKTDSESSVEGGGRLTRVLQVMRKGRSSGSLSSSSRSESEQQEPAWHLKITERLRFRFLTPADDVLTHKNRTQEAGGKKKSIRRRHTMGGQRDLAGLAIIKDWREEGGVDQEADLSALPLAQNRICRDQCRGSDTRVEVAPRAVPEEDPAEAQEGRKPQGAGPVAGVENVNGAGPQVKTSVGGDSHPQKLSGAQVVRSRFYQYL